MTEYYVDTSAVVTRYADEAGSTWIRQMTDPQAQHTILLAEITLAEVAAALAAKARAPGGITQKQRDRILSRFLQDCAEHFVLLPVDRPVIDRAVELIQRHRLRRYDAVQLAAALVASEIIQFQNLSAPTFVAADNDLLTAVTSERLPVEKPLDHTDLDTRSSPSVPASSRTTALQLTPCFFVLYLLTVSLCIFARCLSPFESLCGAHAVQARSIPPNRSA